MRFGNDDSSSDSDNHYRKNIFMSKRALERKNKGKVDLNASKLIQESDVYNEILKKGHEMNEKKKNRLRKNRSHDQRRFSRLQPTTIQSFRKEIRDLK